MSHGFSDRTRRLFRRAACALVICASLTACGGHADNVNAYSLNRLRENAPLSEDGEVVSRWLLAELISPGGTAKNAERARKRLEALRSTTMMAELARGIDDSAHGRLSTAADHFMRTVKAARSSDRPEAGLVAWYATRRAIELSDVTTGLWKRWKPFVESARDKPGNLGWRARADLVDWWVQESYTQVTNVEALAAKHFGCASNLRLAGPFGRGVATDALRSFPAEDPGPWPSRWPKAEGFSDAPHVLEISQEGCVVEADESVRGGIFYAETFLELDSERRVVLAAQGALSIWVNDVKVLDRDLRNWGVWTKFGVELTLPQGRHRILAKVGEPNTSIRILHPNGTPLAVKTSRDPAPGYSLIPPKSITDPNLLRRYVADGNVVDPGDDVVRFIVGYLATHEGEPDVGAVVFEPLVKKPELATGLVLSAAADITEKDPIFDASQTRDLMRELHARAIKKDPKLWRSRLAMALWEGEQRGAIAAIEPVRKLVKEFPEVPVVLAALSRVYGELGWTAELRATVKQLVQTYPENLEALHAAVDIYDSEGEHEAADKLVERVRRLDPDSEIALDRALARENYQKALGELKRLSKRHPDHKGLAARIHDVMVRAGDKQQTFKQLEQALEENPQDGALRLSLADARYARGQHGALGKALVSALETGAPSEKLQAAIDLIEGMTELEPYRLDALPIIRAYEKSGKEMPGTAARVLDYAAVWVHADGSSRMLEHEVIRIQSAEGISKFAEHPLLDGIVLHMRVIKKDGRILEPERVSGKPTVTLPHLEVGDYIETEHIVTRAGDGRGGNSYVGPHWYFREENIAYARSEFVVIAPSNKPLFVETYNQVPAPEVTHDGPLTVRRWRVDESPAAPREPNSAPAREFLPSVRVGWGIDLKQRLEMLSDAVADLTPVDPRIVRIAERIVEPLPKAKIAERAQRLYRWVLANVEQGEETDGRRVVVSKNGNLWRGFMTLCRALGIQVQYAVAKNRLALPPKGPISRAEVFSEPLLRLKTQKGPIWLTVSNKYAPFGYVPAELRGMPAHILTGKVAETVTVPSGGAQDAVRYQGTAKLSKNGSAVVDLVLEFGGKYATALRNGISQLPESQLRDVIESRLLGGTLRGARLIEHKVEAMDDLDKPLRIRVKTEVPQFAQVNQGTLVVSPSFSPQLGRLAALPSRQTPLLLKDATYQSVKLVIELPKGASVQTRVKPRRFANRDRQVIIKDKFGDGKLTFDRSIDLPAGRIQPNEYPKFAKFANQADDALFASVRVRL